MKHSMFAWPLAALAMISTGAAASAAPHSLHYLTVAEVSPEHVLPAPPAAGSDTEKAELAQVRALIAGASAERLELARWDAAHESPALFDRTLGIELEKLPLTWSLLQEVREEAAAAVSFSKDHFHRTRPWRVDPNLSTCVKTEGKKPSDSYPSGHAILGYTSGYILAQLLPGRAAEINNRAAQYAISREICGVHFPSDIDASHALGTLVAVKLMANPAFRAKFDAARTELAATGVKGN